jgi:hypothetical protein
MDGYLGPRHACEIDKYRLSIRFFFFLHPTYSTYNTSSLPYAKQCIDLTLTRGNGKLQRCIIPRSTVNRPHLIAVPAPQR